MRMQLRDHRAETTIKDGMLFLRMTYFFIELSNFCLQATNGTGDPKHIGWVSLEMNHWTVTRFSQELHYLGYQVMRGRPLPQFVLQSAEWQRMKAAYDICRKFFPRIGEEIPEELKESMVAGSAR